MLMIEQALIKTLGFGSNEKSCKQCGAGYGRNPKYSNAQWERSKFCSRKCQSIGKDMSNFVSPLKGKKTAKPRKCSECSEISERIAHYQKWDRLLCDKHYMQYSRYGRAVWADERPLRSPLSKGIKSMNAYRDWRKAVFERDSYTCVWCGKVGYELAPDHIKPFALIVRESGIKTAKESLAITELWDVGNGRTLCRPCHIKTPTFGRNVYKPSSALAEEESSKA